MQRLHSWLFQITARPTRNLCAWNSAKSECISKFLSPKAPRLKYGKRRCLDSVRNYEGYLRDLERCSPTRYGVSDYFFIPLPAVKLWSFGPWNKIRTDPLWQGNGLQSLFKSRPVSIPVWCIAWLKYSRQQLHTFAVSVKSIVSLFVREITVNELALAGLRSLPILASAQGAISDSCLTYNVVYGFHI